MRAIEAFRDPCSSGKPRAGPRERPTPVKATRGPLSVGKFYIITTPSTSAPDCYHSIALATLNNFPDKVLLIYKIFD